MVVSLSGVFAVRYPNGKVETVCRRCLHQMRKDSPNSPVEVMEESTEGCAVCARLEAAQKVVVR